jgi:hypothetical protein
LLHEKYPSLYDLVWESLESGYRIRELVGNHLSKEKLSYDRVYTGKDAWTLLPSFDHPRDPMHCVVSGTGLTHKSSAENRSEMHRKAKEKEALSDSMRMYLMGEEGGKPAQGAIGVQPEWFYKGNGTVLRGHASSLQIPAYALDGGEEPEIAGLYVVDSAGMPVRIGMSQGNEFSDHGMEQKNYLYLAPSKLRQCAIGPELVTGATFSDIAGTVTIERGGATLWSMPVKTGEVNSTHSLENLEHHHFKYSQHRLPGQVHIHFFGAFGLSFNEGIRLEDGDEMVISMKGFGRPLRNRVKQLHGPDQPIGIRQLP